VVLWAKTPKAARRLAGQFEAREAKKEYWALVEGRPSADSGVWDDWLCLDDTGLGRGAQICSAAAPRARQALTRFRCDRAQQLPEACAWLRLWPETGRTHQLRVQAASRGHPILGDITYGASRPFPDGIALHAQALTVRHPVTGQSLTFEAPLPASWSAAGATLCSSAF
jgi:23S rRNA pseudouridine1911/1915/1917 synthase